MNTNGKNESARLDSFFEAIDAHCDALEHVSLKEAQTRLTARGIDTGPTKEKIRNLLELAKTMNQSDVKPNSQSPAREIIEGVKDGLASAAQAGMANPFPRWSGRVNLPKGLEDFINSVADMLFMKTECLALSADSPATEFRTKVCRVAGHDLRLLLSTQADSGKLALVVTDATGEPSRALDGAKLISTSGSEIVEIKDRSAVLDAAMLKDDFIMISPTGLPLTLKPE